jgi:hypothetical protein
VYLETGIIQNTVRAEKMKLLFTVTLTNVQSIPFCGEGE